MFLSWYVDWLKSLIPTGLKHNRFAVCKFLLIPLLVDPDQSFYCGCKRFKREESIREAE